MDDARHGRRVQARLLEKALASRSEAHLAQAKAELLTSTLKEVDSTRRVLSDALHDLERRQRDAEDRNALLKARQEMLETLAFGLAHDLRQPTLAVRLTMSSFDAATVRPDELERCKTQVHLALDSFERTLEDLLELVRFPVIAIHDDRVDVAAYVKQCVARLRAGEDKRKVDLVVEPDLVLIGDRSLIELALRNLLTNAWKFTRSKKEAQIIVGAAPSADASAAVVFVRDNGVGFDAAALAREEQVGRRAASGAMHGLGFGIQVARHAAMLQRGRLWFESSPGAGATFYLQIGARDSADLEEGSGGGGSR
ncbi:MAG: HAMP domain-containing histidine kinase [Sandaracinaceae bacterium]|nr:HAMP domain-containing histidine kinase [Sandaracinaceae bacterium]